MKILDFIEKYNAILSLLISVTGVVISLASDSNKLLFVKIFSLITLTVIIYYVLLVKKLKIKIQDMQIIIDKHNNYADGLACEILNRFQNTSEVNLKLTYENIVQSSRITGFTVTLDSEFNGRCIHPDGEDSYHCEIFGDASIKFADINYKYFDLKNAPNNHTGMNATEVKESKKSIKVKNRFLKKLNNGDSFHLKYKCVIPNTITYGDDYVSAHIPNCLEGLANFEYSVIFDNEKPEFVEAFDCTRGGDGEFMIRLETFDTQSPFIYKHTLNNVVGVKDFIYKFRRNI